MMYKVLHRKLKIKNNATKKMEGGGRGGGFEVSFSGRVSSSKNYYHNSHLKTVDCPIFEEIKLQQKV